jgi:hypothetical protein
MNFDEVVRIKLRGNGARPLVTTGLLNAKDHLIVIRHGKPPFLTTLGVPHQAAPGAEQICECRLDAQGNPLPREADENAALYALAAFHALTRRGAACKLVIMAHASTHDPNKVPDSPYCQEIFAEPSQLLFECHGSKRERRLDLELSAGKNQLSDPLLFGKIFAKAMHYRFQLGVQREKEKRLALVYEIGGQTQEGMLELPARRTHSLAEAGRRNLPALHLEAKPIFRRAAGQGNVPSQESLLLGEGIAVSILKYLSL